ncbi:hypothetical protein VTL71DRAFT_13821 [Oculimacula yallundae]|uniref:Uncharacterized protein n=1 Tax=Oculimacula yallundae TaxID=86028 RepID=A0ABR4CLX6_9HELO
MPRKLPWQVAASSTAARPKRSAGTPTAKRQKVQRTNSYSDEEGTKAVSKKSISHDLDHPPSSSPAPDPPLESFMDDGADKDDQYRMVEDEFLSVAQQFTVHLHAAEYKRQQKAVKNQNAETINSISRPVTGKMPDQTKRKLEANSIAKRQRAMIEGFAGTKQSGTNSDDSDIEELPYVGTTLHGLMDSPRKKAASLARLGSTATTRAAAGFKKPAVQTNADQYTSLMDSPEPKHVTRQVQVKVPTESTDDDDDLDAPIPAPKLLAISKRAPSSSNSHFVPLKSTPIKHEPLASFSDAPKMEPVIKVEPSFPSRSTFSAVSIQPVEAAPKLSRLERIRLARAKKEKEQQIKKEEDYNTIPTF